MAGPSLPHLPVEVDTSVRQVDGDVDTAPVYQTHRGKMPTSRDLGGQPPSPYVPEGPVRYAQD